MLFTAFGTFKVVWFLFFPKQEPFYSLCNIHIPSEAELVKCRQHIWEVNKSHELVLCFNNGWSGNHYVSLGFSITVFHTSQGFNAKKLRK